MYDSHSRNHSIVSLIFLCRPEGIGGNWGHKTCPMIASSTSIHTPQVQRDAKEFVLEADFAKNFRGLVDSSALLLSELEALRVS